MAEIRTYPYLIPDVQRITVVRDWQYYDAAGVVELSELLMKWDPGISIDASICLKIDLESIYQECDLSADAKLRLVSGWRSTGTMLRGGGNRVDLGMINSSEPINLSVHVEGTDVTRDLVLFAAIVIVSVGSEPGLLSPKIPGSVLWINENKISLETDIHFFPIEVADFNLKDSLAPADAAWYVQWDPDDLYQTIDDVLLYLNSAHPLMLQVLEDAQSPSDIVQRLLFFDIARNLIVGALANSEFVEEPTQFPEGTVGAVIYNIIRDYFPNYTVTSLYKLSRNTSLFEAKLQHYLRFLQG